MKDDMPSLLTRRWLLRLVVAGLLAGTAALLAPATRAVAHPLGNFSVNQYTGLTFAPDRVRVVAVVNTAEIPTRQDRSLVDGNRDGTITDAERANHAARACADLAAGLTVRVASQSLVWTVTPGGYGYATGSAGLPTARLSCGLAAAARLNAPVTVTVANMYLAGRVGWHEMTATGDRVHVVDSPLPARSVSDELRAYPSVPAPSSVLDVRTATLRIAPGTGAGPGAGPGAGAPRPAGGGSLTAATAWAERGFERLAAGRLTPLLAVLAVLLALLLGAGHALLPGHGKTVLAAYLAGRAGRPRDALAVGATVTVTHTAGVLVAGLLLTTVTGLAGDRLLGYLGLASGVLIAAVGIGMCASVRRRAATPDEHHHHHPHGTDGDHQHPVRRGRLGLTGIGVAGGLVPSPSALVVLLAAAGLGRTLFGVLLVVLYGLGMAATLTGAGLLLLAAQRRVARIGGRLSRLASALPRVAPPVTAGLVVIIGVGIAARAVMSLS